MLSSDSFSDGFASTGQRSKTRLRVDPVPDRTIALRVRNSVDIPLRGGARAAFVTFDGFAQGVEHFALRFGAPDLHSAPLVRMHSECVTGDVFGSLRCDCGAQLAQAVELLQAEGGILLYLRQEGRGIGLAAKLDAYVLQDRGFDTYAANTAMALPADGRDYACGANMLRALGICRIRLVTNNPDKVEQLARYGVNVIERLATDTFLTEFNRDYLLAKSRITGHSLSL